MSSPFTLDPRLEADSVPVTALGLSDLRLMKDSRFTWTILVPRREGAVEIIDLDKPDRAALFEEIAAVSAAIRTLTGCDKLNVAALGNAVPQLHVHVIARFKRDDAWPGPVWNSGYPVAYSTAEQARLVASLSEALRP